MGHDTDAITGLVNRWIRPEIRELAAYHVADASGMIKLDAMENPYTWSTLLRQEWADLIRETDVNRYPDPVASKLTHALQQSLNLPADMKLMLGNGSDEIIQIIAMGLAGPGRTLLSVEPGFVMYKMIAEFCRMEYVGVPLVAKDFSLDMPAMLQAIEKHQPAVIFIAYPNNPTGNLFSEQDIEQIIQASPGLVIIDEAYAPFTDASFLNKLGQFDNLLVMRTLSKMGLAGLRLGLLAGPAAWLDQFDKLRLPYNINVLTQVSAGFALRHQRLFDAQTSSIRIDRDKLISDLEAMDGVRPMPSDANFVLVKLPEGQAGFIHAGMKMRGVLVKNLDGSKAMLADCLRLTVGKADQNVDMLKALKAALADAHLLEESDG